MRTTLVGVIIGFVLLSMSARGSAELCPLDSYRNLLRWGKEACEKAKGTIESPKQDDQEAAAGLLYGTADRLESIKEVRLPDGTTMRVDNASISRLLRRAADAGGEQGKKNLERAMTKLDAAISATQHMEQAVGKLATIDAENARQTLKQVLQRPEFQESESWLVKLWLWLEKNIITPAGTVLGPVGKWLGKVFSAIGKVIWAVLKPVGTVLLYIGKAIWWLIQAIASLPREVLFVLVPVLVLIIGWLVWRYFLPMRLAKLQAAEAEAPAPLRQADVRKLLWEAEAAATEGNYTDALRKLYLAMLLTLDRQGLTRFHESRTNWEYVRDLSRAGRTALAQLFSQVTLLFDRCIYANKDAGPQDYQTARQSYEQLTEFAKP